jgi:hypothetical protein
MLELINLRTVPPDMKRNCPALALCALVSAALALILSGTSLQARQDVGTTDPGVTPSGSTNQPPGETLRCVYASLMWANGYYDGHVASALREISDAAALCGVKLEGRGTGNEPLEASDSRVDLGRQSLRQLRPQLTGQEQTQMLTHVDNAIDHLTLALDTVTADPSPTVLPIPISPEDTDALQMAYLIISGAKGNYNGHRASAMGKIRLAARLAGVEVRGMARENEAQSKSDARFTLAWRYLTMVRSHLTADEQKPMLKFVDAAINQITLGLEYRASLPATDPPQ